MHWGLFLEIVGIVGGIATLIALMLGPMFYLGSKIENLRNKMDEVKNKLDDDMNEIRKEMNEFKSAFHKETKDFHARLCIIEERKIQDRY